MLVTAWLQELGSEVLEEMFSTLPIRSQRDSPIKNTHLTLFLDPRRGGGGEGGEGGVESVICAAV